jgi:hypothetical protein
VSHRKILGRKMGLGHRDYRFMYSLESGGLYLAPSTYVAHFTHEHQRECAHIILDRYSYKKTRWCGWEG